MKSTENRRIALDHAMKYVQLTHQNRRQSELGREYPAEARVVEVAKAFTNFLDGEDEK